MCTVLLVICILYFWKYVYCTLVICILYFGNMYTVRLVMCILYSEVFLNLTEVSLTPTEISSCFFLSCKANARVKLAKTGHGPHSSTLVVIV